VVVAVAVAVGITAAVEEEAVGPTRVVVAAVGPTRAVVAEVGPIRAEEAVGPTRAVVAVGTTRAEVGTTAASGTTSGGTTTNGITNGTTTVAANGLTRAESGPTSVGATAPTADRRVPRPAGQADRRLVVGDPIDRTFAGCPELPFDAGRSVSREPPGNRSRQRIDGSLLIRWFLAS
jgi:hypothetical protein